MKKKARAQLCRNSARFSAVADRTRLPRQAKKQGELTLTELKDFTGRPTTSRSDPSPAAGKPGSLTPPRDFNLMFQTNVGPLSDTSSVAYLRPETAQNIFTNFKNVVATGRVKVPPSAARNSAAQFGRAQFGAQSGPVLRRNSARNSLTVPLRPQVPFGIAQIGKAFRNEITPRNFIFRSREFEQMEIEYFIPPDDDVWQGSTRNGSDV